MGSNTEFLQAPLLSPTYSLLSGLWLDFHQLVNDHAGRTTREKLAEQLQQGIHKDLARRARKRTKRF